MKRTPVRKMSVAAYITFTLPAFINVRLTSIFRFLGYEWLNLISYIITAFTKKTRHQPNTKAKSILLSLACDVHVVEPMS